jgi:ABC-type ATPase involved in cell division
MESWHKKIGYYKNPFLCNPHKEHFSLVGNKEELEKATYYISSGSIIFIEGEKGSGKTKFLKTIIKKYPNKIIYINAGKLIKTVNVEDLIRKRNGFFSSLKKNLSIDNILIVDNVNELPLINMERLKYLYDQGIVQSIIFAGEKLSKAKLPESMHSRIGKRVIKLQELTVQEAISLVASRLGEQLDDEDAVISKELIEEVFIESKKNPKTFLINMHRIFEEMVLNNEEKVTQKHLIVLKDKLDEEEVKEFEEELDVEESSEKYYDKKGNEIIKIGNYYRNLKEDIFCSNCGAIVEVNDSVCPECNSIFEDDEDVEKENKTTNKKSEEKKEISKDKNKKEESAKTKKTTEKKTEEKKKKPATTKKTTEKKTEEKK